MTISFFIVFSPGGFGDGYMRRASEKREKFFRTGWFAKNSVYRAARRGVHVGAGRQNGAFNGGVLCSPASDQGRTFRLAGAEFVPADEV